MKTEMVQLCFVKFSAVKFHENIFSGFSSCEIWGSYIGAAEDSNLLGFCA
jgi:hypothetical protein